MTKMSKDEAIRYSVTNEGVIKRFKSYLQEQEDGCIVWTGYKTPKGYGEIMIFIKDICHNPVRVHRLSYALHYGFDELPKGTDKTQKREVLHHKCENKACVNPLHLEVVSDKWNLGRTNDKNL